MVRTGEKSIDNERYGDGQHRPQTLIKISHRFAKVQSFRRMREISDNFILIEYMICIYFPIIKTRNDPREAHDSVARSGGCKFLNSSVCTRESPWKEIFLFPSPK